jgi:hypothetical protein
MKKIAKVSLIGGICILFITQFGISSCSKSPITSTSDTITIIKHDTTNICPSATYPISGVWIGTYSTSQVNHTPAYVSFIILPDGYFLKRCNVVGTSEYSLSKGRWSLSGTTFTYRDTSISYSGGTVVNTGSATYHNNGTLTNATWQDIYGQSYSGTYNNVTRIN